jgi:hypothetical protein
MPTRATVAQTNPVVSFASFHRLICGSGRMNPLLSATVVQRAYERDPQAAASEFGGQFRNDISGFLDFVLFSVAAMSTTALVGLNGVGAAPERCRLRTFPLSLRLPLGLQSNLPAGERELHLCGR